MAKEVASFRLSKEIIEALERKSDKELRSRSNLVEKILAQALNVKPKKNKK